MTAQPGRLTVAGSPSSDWVMPPLPVSGSCSPTDPRQVRVSSLVGAPAWSPDGARIAVMPGKSLWIVNANGAGGRRQDPRLASRHGAVQVTCVVPGRVDHRLRGNESIAAGIGDWFTQVYLMNADGTNIRRLTSGRRRRYSVRRRKPGVVAGWNRNWRIGALRRPHGDPVRALAPPPITGGGGGPSPVTGLNAHPSWSPDGTLAGVRFALRQRAAGTAAH